MIITFIIVSIVTLAICAGYAQSWLRLNSLPQLCEAPVSADAPLVSLLIPARNEERGIARCVLGALAQHYPHYEVIVVDDGSTDATPAILTRYAADTRLRVINGRGLPPGWTGKCNACQQLGDAAQGEWLLFLDADTAPQPQMVAAMVAYAQRHERDMLSLFPLIELGSFWERVVLPPFFGFVIAMFPVGRVNAPDAKPSEVMANGQCILIKRAVYEAIGGHGVVRNEVLEDVLLAQAVRTAGYNVGGVAGLEHLRVRMYTNGAEVAEGLAKHAAAGLRSGGRRLPWAIAAHLALTFMPLLLVGIGAALVVAHDNVFAWAVVAHGLVAVAIAVLFWATLLRRLYHQPAFYALLWPFGLLAYLLIAAGGAWRVQTGRGVVWKGRSYAGK